MFNFLGFSELILILGLAMIIFGPDKLSEISKSLGTSVGKFKQSMDGFEEMDKELKDSFDLSKDLSKKD